MTQRLIIFAILIGLMNSCDDRPQLATLRLENQSSEDVHSATLTGAGGAVFRFGAVISGGVAVAQAIYRIEGGATYTLDWLVGDIPYSKSFSVPTEQGDPERVRIVISKELKIRVSFK